MRTAPRFPSLVVDLDLIEFSLNELVEVAAIDEDRRSI
jgi:hypothetical protein